MTLTQRENFELMLKGEKPEYSPILYEMYKACMLATNNTDQPWKGGQDPFGINWVATAEGVIPEPGKILFDDIADWKRYVKFPDIDSLGIEKMAQMELADYTDEKRKEQPLAVFNVCGIFERMAAFMGFENTLCALIEDPDSCHEFFEAMADYKIACLNRYIDVYNPDVIIYFDDFATARGLFMSPKTYREVIKPHHKRIIEAVTSRGVIFSQHTCGKCEDILEDYVEMGVRIWNSAQVCNDLDGILTKYHGRLLVEGGWDTSGPASYMGAPVEAIIEETKRCAEQYGKKGNFILFPVIMNEKGNAFMTGDERIPMLMKTWHEVNKL
ncbi:MULTISPECIES: uroporphyrinogen decarboxylase family protein [Dehalobacter]|uniref:uroporphyrinogen decarboxylase family protein n=1 Tax=Dehalobacter TaxID=56112 RepID=UPI00083B43CB|nr:MULTISPECIES: uroporphyrinogen decarboxylase family protein [Dehalobacter]MCG1025854.1 uroporphyrinogen-III decarboxylase [Dehalobacter sp.]OCZ50950.1 uroporphyrinogen-III decarboxylase [Dehalobacter sp. TeCB1]